MEAGSGRGAAGPWRVYGGQVRALAVPDDEGAPGRPRVVGDWTRRHRSMSLLADGRILAVLVGE